MRTALKFWLRRASKLIRRRRFRVMLWEPLERREMLAIDGWNNVLQPLSVLSSPVQDVSPLDALAVINEINARRYSDASGRLPDQPPADERPPYFDVNCNGSVDPLDVLLVINHLNGGPKPSGWALSEVGTQPGAGFISASSCAPQLNEGNSLKTELTASLRIPNDHSAIKLTFQGPEFDTTSIGTIQDAFEILVQDNQGNPLVLPYRPQLDAAYNWSEAIQPTYGPAVVPSAASSDQTAIISLQGVTAGTHANVSVRLLNNDHDTGTHVVIRGIELVPATGPNPTSSVWNESRNKDSGAVLPWSQLEDLSGSFKANFGRTTYTEDRRSLITDLSIENQSNATAKQELLAVVDSISDLQVTVSAPDGWLADGRPYFRMRPANGASQYVPTQMSEPRELRFANPSGKQFTFEIKTLGTLHRGAIEFTSNPILEIQAGQTYQYSAFAKSSEDAAVRYELVGGPASMLVNTQSGQLRWTTLTADVGRHTVTLRATDEYGNSAEQSFSVDVRSVLVNRPPIITSTPETDAVISSPFEVQTYATGSGPVAVGVLSQSNGSLSLITANEGEQRLGYLDGPPRYFGSSKPISIGEPDPSALGTPFNTAYPVPLGLAPNTFGDFQRDIQGVLTEDVNNDGYPDLIVLANRSSSGNWNDANDRGHVIVRLGNGEGTFREGWQATLPTVAGRVGRAASAHLKDVTSDGRLDLIVTTIATNQTLVYPGNFASLFDTTPVVSANEGNYVANTQLADLNADGKLDLVLFENTQVQISGRQGIGIQLGDGKGRFSGTTLFSAANNNGGYGYVADVDGINGPDLVRLNYNDTRIEVQLNDGNGQFGSSIHSLVRTYFNSNNSGARNINPTTAYIDDFDDDGKLDALVGSPTGIALLKGLGNGQFGDGTQSGNAVIFNSNFDDPNWPGIANSDGRGKDLNGDGELDFVFGDTANAGNIMIGLGDGNGSFGLRQYNASFEDDIGQGIIRNARTAQYIAVADFNRDGVVDLAVGASQRDQQPGSVGILLGDLPGTLRAPNFVNDYSYTESYQAIKGRSGESATGDFNGDGYFDIVTMGGTGFGSAFYFAAGRGDGTFAPYQSALGGIQGDNSLTALDIDRDGILDLAWMDGGRFGQAFGLGNGAFQYLPTISAQGGGPGGVSKQILQTDDFNRDGYPDLVYRLQTGNIDNNANSKIVVLIYDPANRRYRELADPSNLITFTPRAFGFYHDEALGMGDLNNDGVNEFFAFSRNNPNNGTPARFAIYEQTGNAGNDASILFRKTVIENPAFIPADQSIHSYFVDDFDHDGKNDIAYSTHSAVTIVMLGNGDFTFRDPTTYLTNGLLLQGGDFNGDGLTDLATTWGYGFLSYSQRPFNGVLLGNADGTFSEHYGYATATAQMNGLFIGDFNGDGIDDLTGLGGLKHNEAFISKSRGLSDIAIGDVNGDGLSDTVAVVAGLDRVKLLYGVVDEVFSRQPDLFTDLYPVAVELVDADDDDLLDILTANQVGKSLSLFHYTSASTYSRTDIDLPLRPTDLILGDLNGDGKADAIAISSLDQTLVGLVAANDTFGITLVLPLGFSPSGVTASDVSGDGKIDLVLSDSAGDRLIVLQGRGDGSFLSPIAIPAIHEPGALGIADFNADGRMDIVVAQPEDDRIALFLNRGSGRFTSPQFITVGDHPVAIQIRDVNKDNKPDILVPNQDENTISVILNRFDPNQVWSYKPTATDPDGDVVTLDLTSAPGGMLYDSASNTIYWAPMPEQIGSNSVVLTASDGNGGATDQGFAVTVTAPVTVVPPIFTSTPVTTFGADEVYRYELNVQAVENGPKRFSLVNGPTGMTIDPTTGVVEWDDRTKGIQLFANYADPESPASNRNNGQIQIPDSPSLRSSSVTAEGWFNFEDPKGALWDQLLSKQLASASSSTPSWGLEYYYGTLRAHVGKPGLSTSLATVTAPAPIEFNKWTHIALTFDDNSKRLTLYVNGKNTGSAISPESIGYNAQPLVSGSNYITLSRVKVWDTARSESEIAALALAEIPSNNPGLVLDLKFQESKDVSTILDASNSRNHGSLIGTPDLVNFPNRVPALASQGNHPVTIRVDDGKGGVTEQSFSISVKAPTVTQVSGTVYDDVNGNGVWDRRAGENLVFNGDFGSGAVGFTTDFVQRKDANAFGWLGNSQSTVSNTTKAFPLTSETTAHTYGSASDLMLLANGDTQDRVAWRQTIPTVVGQSYEFSFWATRPNSYEAARLSVRVNGQLLGTTLSLNDLGLNQWKRFFGTVQADASTTLVEIVLLGATTAPNPGLGGAETVVGVDDILLVPINARRLVVSGKANPYLAGMPEGSSAFGGTVPQASPPAVTVVAGQVLRVSATGHTIADGFFGSRSPDGLVYVSTGLVTQSALNGISQFAGPHYGSLLGVFLDDNAPAGQTPPVALDFRSTGSVSGGINYTSLQPALRQVFFIGDGRTADGVEQSITVPPGATRLFFANSSTGNWNANSGDFEVQVFDSISEPVQANRQVFVDSNFNGRFDTSEPSTRTNVSGVYALPIPGTAAQLGLYGKEGELQTAPGIPYRTFDIQTDVLPIDFGSRDIALTESPRFTTQPMTVAIAPGAYLYQSFAQSPTGKPMTYALAVGPQGMSIDPSSGLVRWNPIASNRGDNEVILKATDTDGKLTLQRYTIQVEVNTIPTVTSIPPAFALKDVPFQYQVLAQDAEQSQLRYSLTAAPIGMTIDAATGLIRWLPSSLGTENVSVKIEDQQGGFASHDFLLALQVAGTNRAPELVNDPRASAVVGREFASRIGAIDADNDVLTYSLVSGPNGLTISSQGEVFWQPFNTGSFEFLARVSDSRGGTDEQSYTLNVLSRAPTPDVQITSSPATAAVVGNLFAYAVVAKNGELFELVTSPVGMSINPARGTVRWVPTNDQLGVQTVKIRVTDVLGNVAQQSFVIAVRSSSLVPTISSAPLTEGAVGQTYLYAVTVANPSRSPLTYSLSVAPTGMQIDVALGVITWTPNATQIGPTVVSIQVRDAVGNFSTQTFSIVVSAGALNRPPVTVSNPSIDAVVGTPYAYTMLANDPEGGTVTYAVRTAPSGFSIHPGTGVVIWTPTPTDIGMVAIVLTATDPLGGIAVQSIQIDVRAANRLPTIRSSPTLKVSQGALYQYDVLATDVDREPLFYSLLTAPAGMTIDTLGRIRWQTQLNTPLGGRDVVIRVVDGLGGAVTQSYTFGVVPDTLAPRITIIVGGEPVLYPWTSVPAIVRVIATDDVGLRNVELQVDGQPVELAADGTARVYFSAPGNGRLEAIATDAAGNRGTALARVSMRSGEEDGGGNPAPEATITSVADGAAVGGFVDVVGTAAASDFARYDLSYRRIDESNYKTILSSTTQVMTNSLGKWDTTLLENDNYVLKLEVYDTFGSFAAVEVEVSVSSNLKLGNFRLSFEDMTIPVAGIPITIARTYDTLRADRVGEFGYGWRMEYRNTDLRTSLPKSGLEDIGIYTPFKPGTRVFITLPGGKREGFTFTPEIKVLPGFGRNNNLVLASPRFTPDRGVTSTLSAGSGQLVANEFGELYSAGGIPWNPASPDFGGYTLTTREGIQYRIDGVSGLMTSATDRNGNTLSFSDQGIASNINDIAVVFEKDLRGRIRTIIDPAGNSIRYEYSNSGDLVHILDRESNAEVFTYRSDRPHYLDTVIDPLGRQGIRSEYGSDGRLIATLDANGNAVRTSYDPNNSTVTVRDPLGNPTFIEYDIFGNVVSQTDALGGTTRTEVDSTGRVTSRTDALGRKTLYTSDDRGNVISTVDPTGARIDTQYDQFNKILSVTDALGRTRTYVYDAQGRLTKELDPAGAESSFSYNSRGQIIQSLDPRGATTKFEYDLGGRPVRVIDPEGNVSSNSFNSLNQLTSESTPYSNGIGIQVVRFEYQYDRNGGLISVTGPDGTYRLEPNDAGELSKSIDPTGRVTNFRYAPTGQQIGVTLPGGDSIETTIDQAGRTVQVIQGDGRQITFENDAIGRRTGMTLDGASIAQGYDASGQLTTTVDATGRQTRRAYDAAGRVTSVSNDSGAIAQYDYDAAGQLILAADGTGRGIQFRYDSSGRLSETVVGNGPSTRFEYDEAGNRTSIQAPDGARWNSLFDLGGTLTQILDPLGGVTQFTHDGQGRLNGITDPLGRSTSVYFDAKGRQLQRTLPGGETERSEFDAAGRLARVVDFAGQITTLTYFDNDKIASRTGEDGAETYRYDSGGRLIEVSGPSGATTMSYNATGRQSSRRDGSGITVHQSYDPSGRVTSITTPIGSTARAYDGSGALASVFDMNNKQTLIERDLAGRVIASRIDDELVLSRTYDDHGNSKSITYRDAAGVIVYAIDYQRDVANRITAVTESTGGTRSYEYDLLGRLTKEMTLSGQDSSVISYTYDSTGNMIQRVDSTGQTSFVVDQNDRLNQAGGQVFQNDANGNRIGSGNDRYEYDDQNRLIRAELSSGVLLDYSYSFDGLLQERNENGSVTRFVWDRSTKYPTLLEERNASNAILRRYESNGDDVFKVMDASGSSRYLILDPFGTVRGEYSVTGDLVLIQRDAYGQPKNGTIGGIGFTNGWTDPITGFVFMRSRWYDPATARFLTMDSHAVDPSDPETLNRYAYSANDPVNHYDPTGQFTLSEQITIQYVINGLVAAFFTSSAVAAIRGEGYLYGFGFGSLSQTDNRSGFISGGGGSLGVGLNFGVGIENVSFSNTGHFSTYAVLGATVSADTSFVGTGAYVGAVYDTPSPAHYEGWFWSMTLGGNLVSAAAVLSGNPFKQSANVPAVFNFAWSPVHDPTNHDANGKPRFSHTYAYTPFASPGISVSYYVLLLDLEYNTGDINLLPKGLKGIVDGFIGG